VVIGDRRKYITALIVIDEENVVKYAQDHKIQYTTFASLTRAEEVIRLISDEVEKANRQIARVENIRKFHLLDKNSTRKTVKYSDHESKTKIHLCAIQRYHRSHVYRRPIIPLPRCFPVIILSLLFLSPDIPKSFLSATVQDFQIQLTRLIFLFF
jgi:hypothetical protein